MWLENLIVWLFGFSLFANAMLFVPQAIKIIKQRNANDLSFVTFFGFCLFQVIAVAYGWLKEDYIILSGYSLSLITCGCVTLLMVMYRKG